jgi:hypothetical protein
VVGLHRSQGKRTGGIFAIVNVAEIDLVLAGEEELVRRGKNSERPFPGVENLETISRAQVNRLIIWRAAETVLLPYLCVVAPDEFRVVRDGEALRPAL